MLHLFLLFVFMNMINFRKINKILYRHKQDLYFKHRYSRLTTKLQCSNLQKSYHYGLLPIYLTCVYQW